VTKGGGGAAGFFVQMHESVPFHVAQLDANQLVGSEGYFSHILGAFTNIF
jgi:hypothetical protein